MAAWYSKFLRLFLTIAAMIATTTNSSWSWILPSLFPEPNEEFHLTTMEMVRKYGYPVEKHLVRTADGYILEMHRIPHGRYGPGTVTKRRGQRLRGRTPKCCDGGKPVVLLQHGLGSSSLHWVMLGPEQGLGFFLASRGYDVWMTNSRGNVYSRGHVTHDASDPEGPFWNFDWQEMAEFDSPAQIDYILAETGETSLLAIGYSQGGTQLLALLSERPEYNDKIRAMLLLAPLTFFTSEMTVPKKIVSVAGDTLEVLLGIRELQASSREQIDQTNRLCGDGSVTQELCAEYYCRVYEVERQQLNVSQLPALIGHFDGGSSKQHLHFLQLAKSGDFRKYDYHQAGNMVAYGQSTPPAYNLSQVSVPVSLHFCATDSYADAKDIDLLYRQLANPIGKFLVPRPGFGHMGFLAATDVKKLVFELLSTIMKDY